MKVLSVVGGTADERADACSRVVPELASLGRVVTVTQAGTATDGGSATALAGSGEPDVPEYQLRPDGWRVVGEHRSLRETLETLAPEYDVAVLSGFPESECAKIRLGNGDATDESVIAAVESPASLDPTAVAEELAAVEEFETLGSLVATVKESAAAERAGAIATFTGRVRGKDSPDDAFTSELEFERYDDVAIERLATIREELEAREGIYEVEMHHRTGVVEYGEDIVFVVVLAGHREEAFATVEDGINRLKAEVPLFKKEVTVEDEFWAHEGP
jgi:molybdopterin synthase catalytic subunit